MMYLEFKRVEILIIEVKIVKDAENSNGLARVDATVANGEGEGGNLSKPRRSVPMKRIDARPTTEQVTPTPIGSTAAIRAELESAILPVLEEISIGEQNAAANVVNALIPRVIAARSAQSENRIASHVRSMAGEVAMDSVATFQKVFASNETIVNSMADDLFNELCPV
jgi:hypothetical protein